MDQYKADPILFQRLLQKRIIAHCDNSFSIEGCVHSVDPVTGSLILVQFEEDVCKQLHMLPGENIKSLDVIDGEPTQAQLTFMNNIFKKTEVNLQAEELKKREETLLKWFKSNRVPAELCRDGSIKVMNVATIKPPYDPSYSIECTNEVVLNKVIYLMEKVPEN